ncbi:MAG: peptidase T [Intestinimonas sp.]|nr:peptidase T [Intestinimonas sp.]
MDITERFLRYVSVDTQSDECSHTTPTAEKEKRMGEALTAEMTEIGLHGAHTDGYGYVYGWLPASVGCESIPTLGLIAHMDTSPDASGANVKPRIVHYEGGDIVLNAETGVKLSAEQFESLNAYVGQDLIVTDGTTLLGADDKAGVAEILTALEHLAAHPEIPHGRVAVCITPDEEVGAGADHFDLEQFGAAVAYTVDGGELGGLEYENFNAASARVTVRGVNLHPGSAKNKMKNAALIAVEFATLLPPAETPAHTEGYEGFYHLNRIKANETLAKLHYLIRDHDWERFQKRKDFFTRAAAWLNEKYGPGTVQLELTDSYYNMREKIEPHMYLIHRARSAFRKVGVETREEPIRGGTDGARLSYMGLPCPNLSTGGVNFHGVYEYIPVQSMEKMAEMLVCLITEEDGTKTNNIT